ncbi:hypothetical protein Hanom_Chr03g00224661 [Helianthus anomalus]
MLSQICLHMRTNLHLHVSFARRFPTNASKRCLNKPSLNHFIAFFGLELWSGVTCSLHKQRPVASINNFPSYIFVHNQTYLHGCKN